ncbi:MAG: Hsp70 family protein [Myxococcota bacterium]
MVSLGIDFGTSTTVAAIYRDGKTELVKNPDGEEVTPSCIAFLPSGALSVGRAARARCTIDPANSLYSIKRILGRKWSSSEVTRYAKDYPFTLEPGPDNVPLFVTRAGKLTAMEATGLMLAQLREWPTLKSENIQDVTLTVPVSFQKEQRAALIAAAARAGFEHVELIEEARAAALAYLSGESSDQQVVVYDLGGGTFDLTVMRWAGADYQVLGVGGDSYADYTVLAVGAESYLGGDDIDLRCAKWVAEEILKSYRWDVRTNSASFQKLVSICEGAKISLSTADKEILNLSTIDEVLRDGTCALSRKKLEEVSMELIQRTFVICDHTLKSAGISTRAVDAVVLSGGCTYMPIISRSVESYFSRQPNGHLASDKVVAIGAALHAGRRSDAA